MFWALKKAFFGTFITSVITQMANLMYISSFIIFGQTRAIKWTVPNDFLAKKSNFHFMKVYGLLRPQLKRASITKVNHCDKLLLKYPVLQKTCLKYACTYI